MASARAIIPTIITQILKSNKIKLGNLTPTRDFTYVEDTVDAFVKALKASKISGEVINIGNNFEISIKDSDEINGISIFDYENDKEITYKIVGNLESDPDNGHISIDTPIAKGLVGKFIDDEINIQTPSGNLNFEILEVKHI